MIIKFIERTKALITLTIPVVSIYPPSRSLPNLLNILSTVDDAMPVSTAIWRRVKPWLRR